jgi:anaerobic carbon-monoxide dehydrogenase iron sulfur subunit
MKSRSVLVIDPEKCTGCRVCETVCTFKHEGYVAPKEARISVIKDEVTGVDIPVVCQQCERPLCMEVCPSLSISRNAVTGAVEIDENRCIGCGMCVMACPIGGITVTPRKKMRKCDLCKGDPTCAKYCPGGAIEHLPLTKITEQKRRNGVVNMLKILENE